MTALCSNPPVYALQDCGFARGDTLVAGEGFFEEYHLANPELVVSNPRFTATFFLYTSWDYNAPPEGRWGVDDLSLFAHYIVDEEPLFHIDTDLAQVILDYFASDADPGSGIAIQNTDALGGVTHYFTILLADVEGDATANEGTVRLHISNASHAYGPSDWLTPEQVAMDGFAHEWQHTCHYYYSRGPSGVMNEVQETKLNNWSYDDFDEMCSKMSEALFGVGREVSIEETLYTLSTITSSSSYAARCECLDPPGSGEGQGIACLGDKPHYVQYGLFGNYLNSKFTLTNPLPPHDEQDLFTRWLDLTDSAALPDTIYLHDFDGLARLIDDPAFAPYFAQSSLFGSGQEGKWRELMHRFFLAEFANYKNSPPDPALTLSQWLPHLGNGENSPRYRYGLFDNKNDDWYGKMHVYPPYLSIGNGATRLAGLVECGDLWENQYPGVCIEANWPDWAQWGFTRKQLEVSSYSANYFVLNASPDESGRLRVRFGVEPTYSCIIGDPLQGQHDYSSVAIENTANLDGQGLYYVLLGYRGLGFTPDPVIPSHRLSEFNDEDNIDIIDQGYLEHLNVGSGAELVGDGFGIDGTYTACMLMISAADHAVPRGVVKPSGEIIPYWLEAEVVPEETTFIDGTITAEGTTWGPNQTLWVNEDIEIAQNASLTIRQGTKVWLTGEGDEVRVFGNLSIEGSGLAQTELAASAAFGGTGVLSAIVVETGGTCTIENATLTTLGRFTLANDIGGFSLSSSEVLFSDADALAGIQTHPQQTQTSWLSYCTIRNAVELKLARAEVSDCDIYQRLSGLGDYPLILVDRGTTAISWTTLRFLKLGIDTMPQSSKSGLTVTLNLDEGTTLKGVGQGNVTGISLQHRCNATVRLASIKEGLTTGIEANAGATLMMRNSEVMASDVCILAGSGSSVNLGVMLPDESCTPGEPGCDPGRNAIRHPSQDCHPICIQTQPLICEGIEVNELFHAARVFNRTSAPIWAHGNCWGACVCAEEYFIGSPTYFDVWDPAITCDPCDCLAAFCAGGPGGGFSVVAGGVVGDQEPGEYVIDANPVFSDKCTISRSGASSTPRVKSAVVYDVLGRRLRNLAVESADGRLSIVWNGKLESGRRAAAGVYLIRISEPTREVTFKVIKLR